MSTVYSLRWLFAGSSPALRWLFAGLSGQKRIWVMTSFRGEG